MNMKLVRAAGFCLLSIPGSVLGATPLRFYPKTTLSATNPALFVEYDSVIDAEVAMKEIGASIGERRLVLTRLSAEAVQSDPRLRSLADRSAPGRWVAFKPEPLPRGARVSVVIGRKSYELTTSEELSVLRIDCDGGGQYDPSVPGCLPTAPWVVRFSSQVVPDESKFEFEPPLGKIRLTRYDGDPKALRLRAAFRAATKYRVRIRKGLVDDLGETLARDWEGEMQVGRAILTDTTRARGFAVLGPDSDGVLPVFSSNSRGELAVVLSAFRPQDWNDFRRDPWEAVRGAIVSEQVLSRRDAAPDSIVTSEVKVAGVLKGSLGSVLVEGETTGVGRTLAAVVQRTDLLVDVFVASDSLGVWVTSSRNGDSIKGARVRVSPSDSDATTDRNGLARVPLPDATRGNGLVVVTKDSDVAFVPETPPPWSESLQGELDLWNPPSSSPAATTGMRSFLFAEGGTTFSGGRYRARGWLRRRTAAGLEVPAQSVEIGWTAKVRPAGKESTPTRGTVMSDASGAFDLDVPLPTSKTGRCFLSLTLNTSLLLTEVIGLADPDAHAVTPETRLRAAGPGSGPLATPTPPLFTVDPSPVQAGETVRVRFQRPFRGAQGMLVIAGRDTRFHPIDFSKTAEISVDVRPADAPGVVLYAIAHGAPEAGRKTLRRVEHQEFVTVLPSGTALRGTIEATFSGNDERVILVEARDERMAPLRDVEIALRITDEPLRDPAAHPWRSLGDPHEGPFLRNWSLWPRLLPPIVIQRDDVRREFSRWVDPSIEWLEGGCLHCPSPIRQDSDWHYWMLPIQTRVPLLRTHLFRTGLRPDEKGVVRVQLPASARGTAEVVVASPRGFAFVSKALPAAD